MSIETISEPTKVSAATIYIREDGCFDRASLNLPKPFRVFLTLNLPDLTAIYRVCEHVFGHWDEPRLYPPPRELWEHSSYQYFAPVAGELDTFWISNGPLSIFVPAAIVREAFTDLKDSLDQFGGIENITEP